MRTITKHIKSNAIGINDFFKNQKSTQRESKNFLNIQVLPLKFRMNVCFFVLSFCVIFGMQSCTTVHVYQIGGPGGREMANQPGTEWESEVSNTFLYGAIRDDVRIKNCALGDGTRIHIEEIKVEKNFWRIGLYIVTLGLWDASKISWRCAKPCNP
jgi:hypothetical protein